MERTFDTEPNLHDRFGNDYLGMSCRGKSYRLPPKRWVTLRGGLCCRRIVKDAFHLPRVAVSREQEFSALRSGSISRAGNALCMKNSASVLGEGESAGKGLALNAGGETDVRVGQTQLNVNPARQEQEQVVESEAESESCGPPAQRSGETGIHHASVTASSLPAAKALNPSLFRLDPANPSVPFRALAFPPPTSVNASRGTVGRGMAHPHDAMQEWQQYQALSNFHTLQQDEMRRRGCDSATNNESGMLTRTTTASSPPHGIQRNGLDSMVINVSEPNNMATMPPVHRHEGQFAALYTAQIESAVGGQQGLGLCKESANPTQVPQPSGDQQDHGSGTKRKEAADLREGEERRRKHDTSSEDVSGTPSCPAPSAPPGDDKPAVPAKAEKPATTQAAANATQVADESEEGFFGDAAYYQYEDTPDNALLTNDDVRHQDVLCGRGAHATHHTGNRAFRNDISLLLSQYLNATKLQKTKLADAVVKKVTKRGGRFLKRLEGTGNEEACEAKEVKKRGSTYDEDNVWEVLSYSQSRLKVSQRFRQAASTGLEEG